MNRTTIVTAAMLALCACGGGGPARNAPEAADLPAAAPEQYGGPSPSASATGGPVASAVASATSGAPGTTAGPTARATSVPRDTPTASSTRAVPVPSATAVAKPGPLRVDDSCRRPATSVSGSVTREGEPPPDFVATTVDCKRMTFKEFTKGRPTVVNFYASWCKPCEEEAPHFQDLYEEWQDRGLIVVGIHTKDPSGSPEGFYQKYGWTFPSVWDDGEKILNAFDAKSAAVGTLPISFWIHRDGHIVKIVVGGMSRSAMEQNAERL